MNFKGKKLYLFLLCAWMANIAATSTDCNESCDTSCEKKCDTDCSISKNFWYPRSFSSYQYHDLFQMKHTHPSEKRDGKLNISFITEYMQNIDGKCNSCKNLGAMPFWSGTNQLTIGNNDGKADLDAYQLGFGNIQTDENGIGGIIQLNPRVQSIGCDMMMYWVEKSEERGMYFRLHAPLGGMRVTPRLTEIQPIVPDNNLSFSQVPAGGGEAFDYQFLDYPVPARRYETISDVFFGGLGGCDCSNQLDGSSVYGKQFGLSYGRIAPDSVAIIRLADIAATLGYNVWADEKGWAGLGFKVSFPTGNRPQALYMLEPIYGRAGLWGVGGEVTALYQVWENDAGNRRLTLSLQGEVEHLMHGRTPSMRSFDLKQNGKGSKYLLVQDYIATYASFSPDSAIGDGGLIKPNSQVFEPLFLDIAINYTTLPVLSDFSVEGAVAVMADFAWDNWNFAVGGEFWGRSREKLCIDMASAVHMQALNLNNLAVVGRQLSAYHVPGNFDADENPDVDIYTYLCEPLAKIGQSQDAAILAGVYPHVSAPTTLPEGVKDARLSENRIPANLNDALDICGAEVSHAFTGKVFGHFGYNWKDCNYSPSLAIVAGAEFTNNTNNAVQLWSVGLQGSLNF